MGARMLRDQLNRAGRDVGRRIYAYLLRGMAITRANQAWALDTTYIPMAKGFVDLTAVVDWASHRQFRKKQRFYLKIIDSCSSKRSHL